MIAERMCAVGRWVVFALLVMLIAEPELSRFVGEASGGPMLMMNESSCEIKNQLKPT